MTAVNPQVASSYLGEIKEKFHKHPEELSADELRCLKRYFEEIQASQANQAEMLNLNNEVLRAQAKIRSLELQQQSHLSKAEAMLDILVDRKFVDDETYLPQKMPTPEELKKAKELLENASKEKSSDSEEDEVCSDPQEVAKADESADEAAA
jgi:hypothetical protein